MGLADAYSPDTVIASSPGKEVHDPWAFYLRAALLRQAFANCGKFPTAASRRSLGRVSGPVWLIIPSDQLLIIALVNYCLIIPQGSQTQNKLSLGWTKPNIRPKMDLDQNGFDLSKPSIRSNVVRKLPLPKCGLTSGGTLGIEESCTIVANDEA
ncbi:UNVERIFIED_CONTAM: hypothetical protein Sradi_3599700 [Sesamum radiatum]|uniref:Uncharacterized protein n=1 Tax=Sesamum radiatum TaxID=300843 RepID=A0AAW2QHK9_SESRA